MSTRRSARIAAIPFTHAIAGCLSGAIGEHGLTEQELSTWLDKLAAPLAQLKASYGDRTLALLRIAQDTADLEAVEQAYAKLVAGARAIVFFGIGGSSLGGQALAQLGGWSIPGTADAAQKARPRTRFYDNLDAHTLGAALGAFDLSSARFVVTSKSGGTPETLVQALAALDAVKRAGLERRIPELFLGITEPSREGTVNGLRRLFEAHGIALLEHHTGIGGRFSVLTNVGLLPALARGLDIRALRAGAQSVVEALLSARGAARLRARGGCRGGGGARARTRRAHAGDAALFGSAQSLRALVRAAVGRKPGQEWPRYHAARLPGPRRPAQPTAAFYGWAARASDHGRADADGR